MKGKKGRGEEGERTKRRTCSGREDGGKGEREDWRKEGE